MPIANISELVFLRGQPGQVELKAWLNDNVGEYLCRGEDPVLLIGAGWEIRMERQLTDEGISSQWVLDITDEKKFMLYALRWS